jgi:SET domain
MTFVETIVDADEAEVAEIRIDPITGYRSLYCKKPFQKDEVIIGFMAKAIHDTPNYLTVQVSEHEHIELLPECLECTNHSCDPNCFFDTTTMLLVALRDIKPEEELNFFYPSAEWDMDSPFICSCGSKDCIGEVRGAKYLAKGQVKRYQFTDFIKSKLRLRKG